MNNTYNKNLPMKDVKKLVSAYKATGNSSKAPNELFYTSEQTANCTIVRS